MQESSVLSVRAVIMHAFLMSLLIGSLLEVLIVQQEATA